VDVETNLLVRCERLRQSDDEVVVGLPNARRVPAVDVTFVAVSAAPKSRVTSSRLARVARSVTTAMPRRPSPGSQARSRP